MNYEHVLAWEQEAGTQLALIIKKNWPYCNYDVTVEPASHAQTLYLRVTTNKQAPHGKYPLELALTWNPEEIERYLSADIEEQQRILGDFDKTSRRTIPLIQNRSVEMADGNQTIGRPILMVLDDFDL